MPLHDITQETVDGHGGAIMDHDHEKEFQFKAHHARLLHCSPIASLLINGIIAVSSGRRLRHH